MLCLVDIAGVPLLLWKLLTEMRPGDKVVVARMQRPGSSWLTEREWQEAFLAGAFVSEGFVSRVARAGFNNADRDFFEAVVESYDAVVGGRRYVYERQIASGSLLMELDVQDLRALLDSPLAEVRGHARDKRVPEFVWRAAPAAKRAFLEALFTGDGSSSLLPRSSIQISYSTYSEQLARDVQLLLLEFGVAARICRYEKGELKVVISNRRDARLFAERVGFLGAKQDKLERALASLPQSSRALSRDYVPLRGRVHPLRGRAPLGRQRLAEPAQPRSHRALGARRRRRSSSGSARPRSSAVVEPLVDGDYFYATVDTVEDAGVQPVYSLKVETDDHSFLTNGFVSHNTEARLARLATEMLRDIDADTVEFGPNYDESRQEPLVLPSRFPNLLVNGCDGDRGRHGHQHPAAQPARDRSTPPWPTSTTRRSTWPGLTKHIKGPDFPTGGIIVGRGGIRDAYETGRGRVVVRGKAHIEPMRARQGARSSSPRCPTRCPRATAAATARG